MQVLLSGKPSPLSLSWKSDWEEDSEKFPVWRGNYVFTRGFSAHLRDTVGVHVHTDYRPFPKNTLLAI